MLRWVRGSDVWLLNLIISERICSVYANNITRECFCFDDDAIVMVAQ